MARKKSQKEREVLRATLRNEEWLREQWKKYREELGKERGVAKKIQAKLRDIGAEVTIEAIYYHLRKLKDRTPLSTAQIKPPREIKPPKRPLEEINESQLVKEWGLESQHARKVVQLIREDQAAFQERLVQQRGKVKEDRDLQTLKEVIRSKVEELLRVQLRLLRDEILQEVRQNFHVLRGQPREVIERDKVQSIGDIIENFVALLNYYCKELEKTLQVLPLLDSLATDTQKQELKERINDIRRLFSERD